MNQDDITFREKARSLLGDFFCYIRDLRNELYGNEFVIRETNQYKITGKLSQTKSVEFNYYEPDTGLVKIKNKLKVDEKGMKFEQLFSYPFLNGGSYDLNRAEQSLQTKLKIIENGYISFKVQLNTIIIKIGIEDKKYGNDVVNFQSVKELIITIVLFNSNENGNDDSMYAAYSRQRVAYGAAAYGAMPHNPRPMMPHGMRFPAHW